MKRIEYIDAMRGFTMILVVFSHVLLFTFQRGGDSFSFNDIFVTFRMPLFFFLSGFLMYKPGRFDSIGKTGEFIRKKFVVQIIPTLVFSAAFCFLYSRSYGGLLHDTSKNGFWFTYTLFFYFLIYSIGDLVLGKFLHSRAKLIAGAAMAVLVYAFSKYSLLPTCPWYGSTLYWLIGFNNLQFFLFFFFGATVKRWFGRVETLLDSKAGIAALVSLFLLFEIALYAPASRAALTSVSYSLWSVVKTMAGFWGILVVLAFFRKYQHAFSSEKAIGRSLQYIGTRTLDIYLLHLFLIRCDLSKVGAFFAAHHNPVLELFAGLAGALLVIGLCLVISNIIRCSDFLAKYLFGKVIPVEK